MGDEEDLVIRAILRDELTGQLRVVTDEINNQAKAIDAANRKQRESAKAARDALSAQRKTARETSAAYRTLAGNVSSVSQSITGLASTAAVRGIQTTTAGLTGLAIWAEKTTANLEVTKMSLKTFVGAANADRLFKQLQDLDSQTPFAFPELAATSKQLAAFGVNVERIIPLTTSISAIGAGSGKGVSGLQQLTLALSQVKSAGRLTGEEANQLKEFFNPYALVGDLYGKSVEDVQKALERGATVPADVFLKGVEDLRGPLGIFKGLNEEYAKTTVGAWASFTGDVKGFIGDPDKGAFVGLNKMLGEQLPTVLPVVKEGLKDLSGPLTDLAFAGVQFTKAIIPVATPFLVEGIKGLASGVSSLTADLKDVNPEYAKKFGEGIKSLVEAGEDLGPIVSDLAELTSNVLPFGVSVLGLFVGVLNDLSQSSDVGKYAVTGLLTAVIGFRAISSTVTSIQAVTLAIRGMTAAQVENNAVSKAGLLGKLGVAGAGLYAAYEGATTEGPKSSDALKSGAGLVGGGAAIGAVAGSFVPVVGNVAGAAIGAGIGAGIFTVKGIKGDFGDVNDNLGRSLTAHSAIEDMTPGSRTITSTVRNWGLASSSSGHLTGDAIDVYGSNMASYAQNVKRAGGWATMHDSGNGTHVHARYGDSIDAGRSTGSGWSGAGSTTVNMTVIANSQFDFEESVRRAVERRDKDKKVRTR